MGNGQSQEELNAIAHANQLEHDRLRREFEASQEKLKRDQQDRENQRNDTRLRTNAAEDRNLKKEQALRDDKTKEREAVELKRQAMEKERLERNKLAEEVNKRAEDALREGRQREDARREKDASTELERLKMIQRDKENQKQEERLRENAAEDRRLRREKELREELKQERKAVERRRQAVEQEQLERNKMAEENSKRAEEVFRESQQREDARREREFQEEVERQRIAQKEREDQRKDARLREDAEEKRRMESKKELREERRKEREAAERRQKEIEKEQHERKMQAEKRADDRFKEQLDFNQAELKEKTSEHKEAMTKKEKDMAGVETKFEGKLVKLMEERKHEQERLHSDAKGYDERRTETSRYHFGEIEKQLQRNHEIEEQMGENLLQHEERMVAGYTIFKEGQRRQVVAGTADSTEDHFIDSVNNTRSTGRDVVNAVQSLGNHAYTLCKGVTAPETTIKRLEVAINRIQLKTVKLTDSVDSILAQPENKHKEVKKCQKIARGIQEAVVNLADSIQQFNGSLKINPIKKSPKLFETVMANVKELDKHLSSFPTVSKTNYAVGAIMNSSELIVGTRVACLKSSTTGLAIENQSVKESE